MKLGIPPETFLREYWNKKPLLIKGAVKNASELATFDDFFEMAEDPDFETRIVYEMGGEYPWQAKPGPVTKDDYKKNALWTLICHNLELLNPDFFELKKAVRFVPEWNFDDVMATISKKGASVGAHIDDYSVFIFQGEGSRKWMLQHDPDPEFVPELDIRLLKKFTPDMEWILEPGDMLYIPPGIAHHGVSLEDSISYSIGFKSIRYNQLIDFHITQIIDQAENGSFHDNQISLQNDPFLIQEYVMESIYKDVMKLIADKDLFKQSLMKFLTSPKNAEQNPMEESREEIYHELKNGALFKRDMWAKMAAKETKTGDIEVGINTVLFLISDETYQKIRSYFMNEPETEYHFSKTDLNNVELVEMMITLIGEGAFYLV